MEPSSTTDHEETMFVDSSVDHQISIEESSSEVDFSFNLSSSENTDSDNDFSTEKFQSSQAPTNIEKFGMSDPRVREAILTLTGEFEASESSSESENLDPEEIERRFLEPFKEAQQLLQASTCPSQLVGRDKESEAVYNFIMNSINNKCGGSLYISGKFFFHFIAPYF